MIVVLFQAIATAYVDDWTVQTRQRGRSTFPNVNSKALSAVPQTQVMRAEEFTEFLKKPIVYDKKETELQSNGNFFVALGAREVEVKGHGLLAFTHISKNPDKNPESTKKKSIQYFSLKKLSNFDPMKLLSGTQYNWGHMAPRVFFQGDYKNLVRSFDKTNLFPQLKLANLLWGVFERFVKYESTFKDVDYIVGTGYNSKLEGRCFSGDSSDKFKQYGEPRSFTEDCPLWAPDYVWALVAYTPRFRFPNSVGAKKMHFGFQFPNSVKELLKIDSYNKIRELVTDYEELKGKGAFVFSSEFQNGSSGDYKDAGFDELIETLGKGVGDPETDRHRVKMKQNIQNGLAHAFKDNCDKHGKSNKDPDFVKFCKTLQDSEMLESVWQEAERLPSMKATECRDLRGEIETLWKSFSEMAVSHKKLLEFYLRSIKTKENTDRMVLKLREGETLKLDDFIKHQNEVCELNLHSDMHSTRESALRLWLRQLQKDLAILRSRGLNLINPNRPVMAV